MTKITAVTAANIAASLNMIVPTMTATLKPPRVDIQALRGLAVLTVVLYHAKIGRLQAGFLGVDIFFVISGFLITTLVATGIHRGTFSLSEFYFRRAKRLLPAAYVTFFVTAALAPWFLNQQELRDFATQVVGAVTFTGNIVLWQQTGYFEGAGDLKPLLHVWSLAIEEQYYFLLPAALLLTRPSRWLWGTNALLLISLGLCVSGGFIKPIATFYLLPTRAWELLIGSVGALWVLSPPNDQHQIVSRLVRLLFVPALLCLVLMPFLEVTGNHPGLIAGLVCFATLIVILRNSPQLNNALPTRCLAHVGDFSYSLYLVHWPVIALMKNAWVGSTPELPLDLRLMALLLSFVLAYLLYRLVEDPLRKGRVKLSKRLFAKLLLSSLTLMAITPLAIQAMPTRLDFKEVRKTNFGFSERCEYSTPFVPRRECQSSDQPSLLVWGDSYAMHLVPGLVQEWKNRGVIQSTKSSCGPLLGMAPRRLVHPGHGTVMDQAWAQGCIDFNQSVIDFLGTSASVDTVVLSSPFSAYVTQENYEHVLQTGNSFSSVPVSSAAAQAGLQRTVDAIRAMGKKVVLIAPPPSSDFDIGGCLERLISGNIALGGRKGCTVDRTEYQTKRASVLELIAAVSAAVDVAVIRFDPYLCNATECQTMLAGTMIYRDAGHLSYAGSELLAKKMQLGNLIRTQAK